jgi:hypothetical protein
LPRPAGASDPPYKASQSFFVRKRRNKLQSILPPELRFGVQNTAHGERTFSFPQVALATKSPFGVQSFLD